MTDAIDMEVALLAAVAHDRFTLAKVVDEGFRPELLETPSLQAVAAVLLLLREEGVAGIDPLILRSRLEERGELTSEVAALVEGMSRIAPPHLDQVMAYLDLLKDRASRRRLHNLGASLQQYAHQPGADPMPVADFTADAVRELLDIQRQRMRRRLVPLNDIVHQIARETELRKERILLGYSFAPFERLNRNLSGLRRGFYYGVAGAPRRGKTNLTLHLASAIAVNNNIPVLFVTWEQTQQVLAARLMAKESGLSPAAILSDTVTQRRGGAERLEKAVTATGAYSRFLYIVEGSREHTLDRIRALAYNLMHEFRTDSIAIFLDYLQKIPLPKWSSDLRARIDEVSTGLADLSLELHCPIVAVSSIDKEGCRLDDEPTGEDAGNELLVRARPTMHNCTGAGDIEYDLDVAMVLAKDWRTTRQFAQLLASRRDLADPPKVDILNLYIDKNRDAPEEGGSVIQFAFFVTQNRFVELRYKTEEEDSPEYHGFSMAQEIYQSLVNSGDLPGGELGRSSAAFSSAK